jgi:hypothetical protein
LVGTFLLAEFGTAGLGSLSSLRIAEILNGSNSRLFIFPFGGKDISLFLFVAELEATTTSPQTGVFAIVRLHIM